MANRTMEAVPGARRGNPGSHGHNNQPPTVWASGCTMAPATSAQYPKPFQARAIDITTALARERISLADVAVKRIALLSRAMCTTDILVNTIEMETPIATSVTRGFR